MRAMHTCCVPHCACPGWSPSRRSCASVWQSMLQASWAVPSCPTSTKALSQSVRSPCPARRWPNPICLGASWNRPCWRIPRWCPWHGGPDAPSSTSTREGGRRPTSIVALVRRDRSKAAFLEALRRDFSLLPGMNITIGQPISHRIDHMLSGPRANVAVKIFGDDLSTLRPLGTKVRQAMATVPGVVDLSVEQQIEIPTLSVRFDRPALARYGVMIEDVAHTLEAALQGVTASRVLEGRQAVALVARLSDGASWTPETLGALLVDTPGGAKIHPR